MLLKLRYAVGIGVALGASVIATLIVSLTTASAEPGPGVTATVPITSVPVTTVPTTTAAGPGVPTLPVVHFSRTDPVAGQAFTAALMTITSLYLPPVLMSCDASIRHLKVVYLPVQDFEAPGSIPDTHSCSVYVPRSAAGRLLRVTAYRYNRNGGYFGSFSHRWRILHH